MERACENCGTPDDELMNVRRIYLDPSRPGEILQADETAELWCLSCTSLYPHEILDG